MSQAAGDLSLYDVVEAAAAPDAVVIHPTAIVDPKAQLGVGVHVGPFSVVGPKVTLGDRVRLLSHVTLEGRTTVGASTVIHQYASIGMPPQDLKYQGEDSTLVIGEENSIRQYVNISLGSASGGGETRIGRRNLIMAYCHVAHDCRIGNNIVFANGATLAGHVELSDHVVIGGLAALHQFVRVGPLAMIGGGSMVVQDVPPFTMVQGDRARPSGLNVVGLRRAGYGVEAVRDLKAMYRLLYSEGLTVEDAVGRMEAEISETPYRSLFVDFVRSSQRGICR